MHTRQSVLVVDDEETLRTTLIDQLATTGRFKPTGASSVLTARQALSEQQGRFNAVILDVGLPDGNGREFCTELRQQGLRIPIIMLTAASEESDVVAGLDAGADDYVAKPFRLRELIARLDRVLDTFEKSIFAVLPVGPYLFRPAEKRLHDPRSDRDIDLTDKETAVLRALYDAGGERIDKETLVRQVFGYSPTANTHTLETHVYRIRQKIEDHPMHPEYLVTSESGYRLTPDSPA